MSCWSSLPLFKCRYGNVAGEHSFFICISRFPLFCTLLFLFPPLTAKQSASLAATEGCVWQLFSSLLNSRSWHRPDGPLHFSPKAGH
ncbi:hypothetical protein SRHO_G00096730 [Serrasalmus rhombeus]